MQLVLSNNRIIAHGENFLAMGGVVINTETGAKYENATIAECEGCPSDINEVGYEYHAGVFVPCAPYGKTDKGNLLLACNECATPRRSDISKSDLVLLKSYPIATTADGLNGFTAMIFDGNKYIATSSGGTVQYSEDGITWNIAQDIGTNATARPYIVYGGGRYLLFPYASASSSPIGYYYSDDGITWTYTSGFTNYLYDYIQVAYGNGKFVAVFRDNNYSTTKYLQSAYSEDGINWTISKQFEPYDSAGYGAITYGNGKFVVYASTYIYHSDDGINWTKGTTFANTRNPYITYGNGKFVLAFYHTTNEYVRVYHSDDGINWTSASGLYNVTSTVGITYGNGKFIVGGDNGNYLYSDNGIAWTQGNISNISSVCPVAGADKFIERITLHFSTDAKYWTKGGAHLITGDGQIIMPADLSVIYDEAAAAYAEGVNA